MPSTGEKPGKGTYYCQKCGQRVELDDTTDTLPPCPQCHHTEYNQRELECANSQGALFL